MVTLDGIETLLLSEGERRRQGVIITRNILRPDKRSLALLGLLAENLEAEESGIESTKDFGVTHDYYLNLSETLMLMETVTVVAFRFCAVMRWAPGAAPETLLFDEFAVIPFANGLQLYTLITSITSLS
jgi:hypothetical protein